MAVKAPILAPAPVWSWTGFYLGIGGGMGWGTVEHSINQDVTGTAIAALFGVADPFAFGQADSSHTINGPFFGGQIGANYQVGWAVFGLQADWHWADIEGKGQANTGVFTAFPIGILGTTASASSQVNNFGSVTARLGAAFDRALIYVKGGWTWADIDHSLKLSGLLVGGCPIPGNCTQTGTVSQSRSGWTFGTGIEFAFTPNMSAFAEYSYYDYGSATINQNYTFVANLVTLPVSSEVTDRFHTVKAGVNYRFNWGAPLVAKY